jgi:membrane protein required for colicin V production
MIHRLIAVSGISGVDRSLGFLFGIARGVVIVAILILAATFMDMTTQPWWKDSMLVQHFDPVTDMLKSLMPDDVSVYFEPTVT